MSSAKLDSLLHQCEKLKLSKPVEAYALALKASKIAVKQRDLMVIASIDEMKASLGRVVGKLNEAASAAQSALLYYHAVGNVQKEAHCLLLTGQIEYDRGKVEKALHHYQEAEHIGKSVKDSQDILSKAYGLQSNALLTMGKPALALKYMMKSLHLSKRYNLLPQVGISYQALASFYFLEEDYDKAMMYSNKAFEIFSLLKDKYRLCFNLNSRGMIYSRKRESSEAYKCYIQAVTLAKNIGMIYMNVWSLSNLIEWHIQDKDFTRSNRLIKRLLSLIGSTQLDVVSRATILSAAGSFYMALHKPDLAIKNLRSAMRAFSSSEYGRLQMLEKLLEVYIQMNDVDNAMDTLRQYLSLKEKIFSEENQREISQIQHREHNEDLLKDKQLERYSQHRFEKKEFIHSLNEKLRITKGALISQDTVTSQAEQISDQFDHELYISVTYNTFLTNLARMYPDLSSTERKIATLIRLNMPSKKIASLLSISLRTVEFHRVNIRRKLRLKKEDNIHLFLLKIG